MIKWIRGSDGHYEVYFGDSFLFSADNLQEVSQELKEYFLEVGNE